MYMLFENLIYLYFFMLNTLANLFQKLAYVNFVNELKSFATMLFFL